MELGSNNNSAFLMHYHLVLIVKHRRKVIDDTISNRLREIFESIAPNYNLSVEKWNHDLNYVHILFKGPQNTALSKFINDYQSTSSRLIKEEFPHIKNSLWEETFWSQSFCLLTTEKVTNDIIRLCVETQSEK